MAIKKKSRSETPSKDREAAKRRAKRRKLALVVGLAHARRKRARTARRAA